MARRVRPAAMELEIGVVRWVGGGFIGGWVRGPYKAPRAKTVMMGIFCFQVIWSWMVWDCVSLRYGAGAAGRD